MGEGRLQFMDFDRQGRPNYVHTGRVARRVTDGRGATTASKKKAPRASGQGEGEGAKRKSRPPKAKAQGDAMTTIAAKIADIQAALDALAKQHKVPGASLGILQGNEVVVLATGVTNRNTGVPVTPSTLFQIGSNTKLYTATLVMQLVDEGMVDLDAPVKRYLPDWQLVRRESARRDHRPAPDDAHVRDRGRRLRRVRTRRRRHREVRRIPEGPRCRVSAGRAVVLLQHRLDDARPPRRGVARAAVPQGHARAAAQPDRRPRDDRAARRRCSRTAAPSGTRSRREGRSDRPAAGDDVVLARAGREHDDVDAGRAARVRPDAPQLRTREGHDAGPVRRERAGDAAAAGEVPAIRRSARAWASAGCSPSGAASA